MAGLNNKHESESLQAWHTMLKLKEDHDEIGFKGWAFFIVDFPIDVRTGEILYLISSPTFTGFGVGTGTSSFVLNEEDVKSLFSVMDTTFKKYAKEMVKKEKKKWR